MQMFYEFCCTLSEFVIKYKLEMYRSGRTGTHSKCVCRETGTWVRVPPSPPNKEKTKTRKYYESFNNINDLRRRA